MSPQIAPHLTHSAVTTWNLLTVCHWRNVFLVSVRKIIIHTGLNSMPARAWESDNIHLAIEETLHLMLYHSVILHHPYPNWHRKATGPQFSVTGHQLRSWEPHKSVRVWTSIINEWPFCHLELKFWGRGCVHSYLCMTWHMFIYPCWIDNTQEL